LTQTRSALDDHVVGREAELAPVVSFLSDGDVPGPSALALEGEAGIGKTTIVRAATEHAGSMGLLVLAARPSAGERELPYAALGDLLATIDDDALAILASPQREAVKAALGRTDGSVDEHALSRGVLELLRCLAVERDLLLLVDDVQWLDRPTASALAFALRRIGQARVRVLIAVRREDEAGATLPLGLDEWPTLRRVVVGPMSVTELGALVRKRLGAHLARPRLEALSRESGGNPMFALELARQDANAGAFPTLPRALEKRLLEMETGPRGVLGVAAAALRPSTELLLRAGVEREYLRRALATGLLAADEDRLSFVHPLLQSVAYGLLLPDERRQVHARLAAVSSDPVERGHHLSRSVVGRNDSVAQELEAAAETAAGLGDHAGAAAFLLRAAELAADSDGDRARASRVNAAEELFQAGDLEAAAGLSRDLVERLPAGPARARARLLLSSCLVGSELSYPEELAELERALVDADGDEATSARVHLELAETATGMFRLRDAREHFRAVIRSAERAGLADVEAMALGLLGFVEYLLGLGKTAASLRACELWDDTSFMPVYPPGMAVAEVCLYAGEFREAERLYREELALAEQHGIEVIELIARGHLAETQIRAGDWTAALANARLAHEHARQAAHAQIVNGAAYGLGMIEALLGDLETARARATSALAAAESTGDPWHTIFERAVLGLVALSEDEPATAVDVLTPAWSMMIESELGDLSVFPVPHVLGEGLVQLGRVAEAELVAAKLRACPAGEQPWCRAMAARIEALVASRRGDHNSAREAIASSLAAHAQLPEPFEHARTLHVHGRIERTGRNWGVARAALVDALERFDQLGAARWAEKAAADIARLPGRRPADKDGLTTRERDIAELAAAGLANKEVAARLFVSVHTVEANLSKVYAKLGIRSRTELATRLNG
jgi:DNA-binding NarL/FixJ family response regulator